MDQLPKDFNHEDYRIIHDDLYYMNEKELENHYIKYGKKEGRRLKIDPTIDHFNEVKFYEYFPYFCLVNFKHNLSLFKFSEDIYYYKFFLNNRYNLCDRISEKDKGEFNTLVYIEINKDLKVFYDNKKMSEKDLYNHYINTGYYENRSSKEFINNVFMSNSSIIDKIELTHESKLMGDKNIKDIVFNYDSIFESITSIKYDNLDILDNSIIFDLQDLIEPFCGMNNQSMALINGIIIAKKFNYINVYFTGYATNYDSNILINCNYVYDIIFLNENIKKIYPEINIYFINNTKDVRLYNSIIKHNSIENLNNVKLTNILWFGCSFSGYYYNNDKILFDKIYNCIKFNRGYYEILNDIRDISYLCIHDRSDNDMLKWYNECYSNTGTIENFEDTYDKLYKYMDINKINYFVCSEKYNPNKIITKHRDINAIFEYIIATNCIYFIGFSISSFSFLVSSKIKDHYLLKNTDFSDNINAKIFENSSLNSMYYAYKYTSKKINLFDDIKIGIGIATYYRTNGNSEKYLLRCLKSLEEQIIKNFIVFIIGDDIPKYYEDYILTLIKKFSFKIIYFNNTEYNERNEIKDLTKLWHVAGAFSINKSMDLMLENSINYYVHMDDDNRYSETHIFNISFCYKFLNPDFIFTKGLQNIYALPNLYENILCYLNNVLPHPNGTIHSTISFNLNTIKTRYNNFKITKTAKIPADAELLMNIRKEIFINKLNYLYIPLLTCYEDDIGESKK
jgi:hypothetical protein